MILTFLLYVHCYQSKSIIRALSDIVCRYFIEAVENSSWLLEGLDQDGPKAFLLQSSELNRHPTRFYWSFFKSFFFFFAFHIFKQTISPS